MVYLLDVLTFPVYSQIHPSPFPCSALYEMCVYQYWSCFMLDLANRRPKLKDGKVKEWSTKSMSLILPLNYGISLSNS
jgi:hypothetical protein